MNATVMMAPSLVFDRSESKPLGLEGDLINQLRDNAPRIVGGLKLAGDLAAGFTMNPFMIGYSTFAIIGRLILLTYGTKENQQKAASQRSANAGLPTGDSWQDNLARVFHPREFPVESAAGFSVVAETLGAGYGVSNFMAGKSGFTPLVVGALSVATYANILFGKEAKKDADDAPSASLTFGASESRPVGLLGRIKGMVKDNPVLVSSVIGIGVCAMMLVGGIMESMPTTYIVAAGIFLAANVVQALFVRKNEFNVEGAGESQSTPPASAPPSFKERYAQRGGNLGLQPA